MLKIIAWVCIIGLAVASWTPGQDMIRTGLNTRLEHMMDYMIAEVSTIIAYLRKPLWSLTAALCAYAGNLELGQMYIPGRHAAVLDWIASSSGVFCASVAAIGFKLNIRQYVGLVSQSLASGLFAI